MTDLGDFGTAHDPVDATFGWFGARIRVHPDLTDLAILDLAETLSSTTDGSAAVDAIRNMATVLVHPDSLDEFWRLARANRQSMEDIADLSTRLISGLTDRPTQLPSASSDGQQRTGQSSTADSSSPAMRLLDGRPDLQVAVLRAEERRAG